VPAVIEPSRLREALSSFVTHTHASEDTPSPPRTTCPRVETSVRALDSWSKPLTWQYSVPAQFMPAVYRAVQPEQRRRENEPSPKAKTARSPSHYEEVHHGAKWQLAMTDEVKLGLAPADWSTSSQMNDKRPNGQSLFDARFNRSPMGRARGGHSLVWDPRGMPHAGGAKKAQNMDANVFAADMSDETAIAKASAERNFHKSQK
jgi:hypothetical protein